MNQAFAGALPVAFAREAYVDGIEEPKRPATAARARVLLLLALAALPACATAPARPAGAARDGGAWIERTFRSLSLEDKAGQVVMPVMRGFHAHPKSVAWTQLEALTRDLGAGGFILSRGDPMETVHALNQLQGIARVPLLVAADFEWGAGRQVAHGATLLPGAMAVAAAGSEDLAEAHGRYTAQEGRALGVHMTFAPVTDVNNNPDNPIINVRSYGEDPASVSRLAAAFIRGAKSGRLLTTAKHFPGHGDTAKDSHRELATIAVDRARLEAVELVPFRTAVAAGVDAVMVGHLAVPAVDPSLLPATVSEPLVDGLLRKGLRFEGLVVSDAMDMRGVTDSFAPGEAAVRTLLAGQDMVLMSPDPFAAKAAIVDAVRSGRLPAARLDDAVRRVLRAKVAAGLHRYAPTPPESVWTALGDPDALTDIVRLAEQSITLLRNTADVVPVKGARVLHVTLSGDPLGADPLPAGVEAEVLRLRREAVFVTVEPRTTQADLDAALEKARGAEAVVVSAFVRVGAYKGTADLPAHLAAFVEDLARANPRTVVVSFGSPYLVRQFPGVAGYLCAYSFSPLSQRAAVKVVFGELAPRGRLPVTIPGLFARGAGLPGPAEAAAPPTR